DRDLAAQRSKSHITDILAVDKDGSLERIEKSRNQVNECRFAGAGGSNDRIGLAVRNGEPDVVEHHVVVVSEFHALKPDFILDGLESCGHRFLLHRALCLEQLKDAVRGGK